MEYEYNQSEVAASQLHTAIKLFLDDEDYFSSATLAGAAEEIFGKMLEDKNENNSLEIDANHLLNLLTTAERDILKTKNSERNGVINILNFQKNWLKHRIKDNFTNFSDPKFEANELIHRAVRNYLWLNNERSCIIDRYLEYLSHEE